MLLTVILVLCDGLVIYFGIIVLLTVLQLLLIQLLMECVYWDLMEWMCVVGGWVLVLMLLVNVRAVNFIACLLFVLLFMPSNALLIVFLHVFISLKALIVILLIHYAVCLLLCFSRIVAYSIILCEQQYYLCEG